MKLATGCTTPTTGPLADAFTSTTLFSGVISMRPFFSTITLRFGPLKARNQTIKTKRKIAHTFTDQKNLGNPE